MKKNSLITDKKLHNDKFHENFFVCDIFNTIPKGDTASMEHPVFSLSTKPDMKTKHYTHNEFKLEISPSAKGLATVHDRDILIFCISQIIYNSNKKNKINKTLKFKAHDLLTSTNRQTNGQAYKNLKTSLERLRGTTITTNIKTKNKKQFDVFGLIERARTIYNNKTLFIEITLSEWLLNAIKSNEILTINKYYFHLRKPLERRLYELARKHCGKQPEWKISLELLHKKTGSNSSIKEFKRLTKKIIENNTNINHIPDYKFYLQSNNIIIKPKNNFIKNINNTI